MHLGRLCCWPRTHLGDAVTGRPESGRSRAKEGAIGESAGEKRETVSEKKVQRKWLSRVGTFLLMGGSFLVLFAIGGIVIAVSLLTRNCWRSVLRRRP